MSISSWNPFDSLVVNLTQEVEKNRIECRKKIKGDLEKLCSDYDKKMDAIYEETVRSTSTMVIVGAIITGLVCVFILTFEFVEPSEGMGDRVSLTYLFVVAAVGCILKQMNYLYGW